MQHGLKHVTSSWKTQFDYDILRSFGRIRGMERVFIYLFLQPKNKQTSKQIYKVLPDLSINLSSKPVTSA